MFALLEFIFQGFLEWVYSLILEIWNFFTSSLLNVMTLDFAYIKSHIPVVTDISQILLAVGWALLLGNLVFQALRGMVSGLGFEGEDPKLLFARTFVFGFLLLTSPQICEMVLTMTSTVITLLEIPDAINVHLVDDSIFGVLGASWILVIIFDVITMFMVLSLLLEVAERYMVLAMLTITAPLTFAMGGSKSTSEIFTGWCRMFGSMCFLMALNIVFFKMLLSVVSTVPSFPDVFLWMVLIVSIVKVAKKADEIITRIGLNPAITGNRSTLPGMLAYTVFRTALSLATKGAAKGIGGALGAAGKGAVGAGKSTVGLAGQAAGIAGSGVSGAASGIGGAVAGGIGGTVAGGIGGAVAGATGQRGNRPRYGGGRQQGQQSNNRQEHIQQSQQSTSRTQTNSQRQTAAQEQAGGQRSNPGGIFRTDRPSRKSSVQPGTHRAPSYVTPPSGQSKTEEKSTFQGGTTSTGGFSGFHGPPSRGGGFTEGRGGGFSSGSRGSGFSEGPRGGGFSGGSRGSGFSDGPRGGGFSSGSRGSGFSEGPRGGGFSSGSRGSGFSDAPRGGGFSGGSRGSGFSEAPRGGGFGGTGASKDTPQGGGTFGGRPSGTTRSGGFGGSTGASPRGGGFSHTTSSATSQSSTQENISKTTQTSQTGTAGTQTRSSRRPPDSEPRHSRNRPRATSQPSTGGQGSGPAQQERRKAGSPLKPQMLSTSSQSGTAGTQTRSSQRPPVTEPRHGRNGPWATSQPPTGAQRSGPVQQEPRRAEGKSKPPVKAGGPRPGTAGTAAGPRTPPGQKLSSGPSTQKPTRKTKREGGSTDV